MPISFSACRIISLLILCGVGDGEGFGTGDGEGVAPGDCPSVATGSLATISPAAPIAGTAFRNERRPTCNARLVFEVEVACFGSCRRVEMDSFFFIFVGSYLGETIVPEPTP